MVNQGLCGKLYFVGPVTAICDEFVDLTRLYHHSLNTSWKAVVKHIPHM